MSMSDPLSLVWIFTRVNSPSSTFSYNQWYILCICLVWDWYATFLERCVELWLSQWSKNSLSFIPNSLRKLPIQISSFPASTTAIYFASVVDKATHFCNRDCHDTIPPCIGHHIPWRGSTRIYIPRHVRINKTFKYSFSTPYLRHTLEVPFKNPSIHFTTAQCSLPGLLMYRLTTPTINAMSGFV